MGETKLINAAENRPSLSEPPESPEGPRSAPLERRQDGGVAESAARGANKLDENEWEKLRPEIERLYIDQDKPLKEVMAALKKRGITAT